MAWAYYWTRRHCGDSNGLVTPAKSPKLFTAITLINILVNVGLNLFWLVYCRNLHLNGEIKEGSFIDLVYHHDIGVGYIFISNLVASFVKMICCFPIMLKIPFKFN